MERPKVTRELIASAAATFCAREGWDADQAADLARVCRSAHTDGYELAKELDSMCGWMPTAQDVETLDNFGSEVREVHRQACIAWARDNNVQPPLPLGTITTQGEITGINSYDAACYEIRRPGDTEPTRRYIVRFEDARAAEGAAVGAA
jgi:hypothetical protein